MTDIQQSAPVLETPRLILRGWRDEDVEPWVAMNADPRVMEFFPQTYSRPESMAIIAKRLAKSGQRGYALWIVEIKGTRQFAGRIAMNPVPLNAPFAPGTEISWRFVVDAWGNGYAAESARAAIAHAFKEFENDKVVAETARLNYRSQRLMQKLGMTYDPADDFEDSHLEEGHRLRPRVLYRLQQLEL